MFFNVFSTKTNKPLRREHHFASRWSRKMLEQIRGETHDVDLDATPENIFCFDSEAFRFLACLKNGIDFDPIEKMAFSTSWNKSVEETSKLMEYITSRIPHDIQNTISLNEARRTILLLSKPIAEMTRSISQNIKIINDKKMELESSTQSLSQLASKGAYLFWGMLGVIGF